MDISLLIEQAKGYLVPKTLSTKNRQWLYDILGQRAALGSIGDALPVLMARNRTRGKKGIAKAKILEKIHTPVRSGISIADSLKPLLPEDEYHLISSGERSGKLVTGLYRANARLEQKIAHKKGIQSVLVSFGSQLMLLLGVLSFLGASLFPQLEKLNPVHKWPGISQFIYNLSVSVTTWGSVTVIAICAGFLGIRYLLTHQKNSALRTFLMTYVQPWNLHRDMVAMTTLESFAAMLGSQSEKQVIQTLSESSSSPWFRDCCRLMIARLKKGQGNPFLDNPLLKSELNDVLASIGETGDKSMFYEKTVERLDQKINEKMAAINKRIEVIGKIVLFTVLGATVVGYFLATATLLKGM